MPAPMTRPDSTFASPRPTPAKATLAETSRLSSVVSEAARRALGSQQAAALTLGKDEGNFSRDTKARRLTLAHLEGLGEPFLAELGDLLSKEYGSARIDPLDRAVGLLVQASEALLEAKR